MAQLQTCQIRDIYRRGIWPAANSHSHMKARHHLYKFQSLLYPCALLMQTSPLAIVVSLGWLTVMQLSLIFEFFKMSAISPEFGLLFWNLTSALSRYDKCFFSLCDISLVDEIKVMLISSCHFFHRLLWTSCWLQWIASPGCSCFAGLFVSIRNAIFAVTREARVKGKLGEEKMGGKKTRVHHTSVKAEHAQYCHKTHQQRLTRS